MTFGIASTVNAMAKRLRDDNTPNINELWLQLKEVNAIKWSVKQAGYAIGNELFRRLSEQQVVAHPGSFNISSKPSTQADIESDWFLYWMKQIQSAPLPHRKLWEFAWILQNLDSRGLLNFGRSGLGFGCGEEPLPSYFASRGVKVTVTDLSPDEVAGKGWAETGQHTRYLDSVFKSNLVDKSEFDKLVALNYVDMNRIPDSLYGRYDFCWSVCALEHLGSIEKGIAFILNSLKCLSAGGVALHTTEYNYTETDLTIDNWPTVLFLKKHFEEISDRATALGYIVSPLDFHVGSDPLDNFIDLPPYSFSDFLVYNPSSAENAYRPGHLKLSVDGFPSTCFGIAIEKPTDFVD